jgi:hypothetical protein
MKYIGYEIVIVFNERVHERILGQAFVKIVVVWSFQDGHELELVFPIFHWLDQVHRACVGITFLAGESAARQTVNNG